MPLSPADPAYIAEITPASIAAMERPLCSAFGVGLDAFGAKGNLVHYSGYHRSRQWILTSSDSRYGSTDYSVTQPLDKSGDWRWVSAFDFTPGAWGTPDNRARMRQITGRVYAAAKAKDQRLANLREFAGTLDGKTVITFNCSDGSLKSPFDSSHLDHVHGSFWRSRAGNDHTGVLQVLLGEDDMDLNQVGGIVPGITNAQALKDIWSWAATARGLAPSDPDGVPVARADDRFQDATAPGQVLTAVRSLPLVNIAPATVAALVVEQLGPLLPTLADIEQLIDARVKAALNATHLSV